MIHQLKADGLNHSQIARRLNLDRKTVRRHLSSEPDDTARVPRKARPSKLDRYRGHLQRRVTEHPQLCATRLLREIRAQGYTGGISILRDHLRQIRPAAVREFEIRFETAAGEQAQVDFSCCMIRYNEAPEQVRRVWLFSMVLGHSRYLWGKWCVTINVHILQSMKDRRKWDVEGFFGGVEGSDTGGVSKRTVGARAGGGLRAAGSDHSGMDPERAGGAASG